MRGISLGLLLFAFWLALSGHYTPMLVGLGLASAALCVLAAKRMGTLDEEAHPTHLFLPALTYFPWLTWEIAKSAWGVTKIILNPKLPISPTMTVVKATQRTNAGLVTYANSITLTPGTITAQLKGDHLTVHALARDDADALEGGRMDRRVSQFEGVS